MIEIDNTYTVLAAKQLQQIYEYQNPITRKFLGLKFNSAKQIEFSLALRAIKDPRSITEQDVINALRALCAVSKFYNENVCPWVEGK